MIGGQSPGLLDFTNIAQSNIPISTTAPTHHVSIFNTHLLYSFSKQFFFQNFFGPFLGASGALAHYFEFPFSRYIPPYFSDVSTSFLTSFFTGIKLLMIIEPPDDY